MPGAGSSSYSVTTGPGRALMISPRTPKSPSTPSSAVALAWIRSLESVVRSRAFWRRQEIERRQHDSRRRRCGFGAAARGLRARAWLVVLVRCFVVLPVLHLEVVQRGLVVVEARLDPAMRAIRRRLAER